MSKAETVTCDECFGRYKPETCPKCNGTGIVTGNGLRYVYAPGHDSGATANATGHDGCIRGLEKANATIAEQAAEIERLEGEPIRGMQRLQAETIREQAAEIERLRGELNERGEALTMAEMSLMETDEEVKGLRADRDNWKKLFTDHLAVESQLRAKLAEATLIDAPELRTERDALRLEVQRLKDASFEAQDRYAAIEAERDELRTEIERLKLRLTESLVELGTAEKEIAHMRESNGRADDYSAKLERVIEAVNANAATMVNVLIAMANAGLPMPNCVPLPKPKEADRG